MYYRTSPAEEELKTLFPGLLMNLRELKFLVAYFRINCNLENLTKTGIIEKVVTELRVRSNEIPLIKSLIDSPKIDIEEFKFIEKSKSQEWLVRKAIERLINEGGVLLPQNVLQSGLDQTLGIKDLFIALIDWWRIEVQQKIAFIEWVRNEFDRYLEKTSFIAWYEKEGDRPKIAFDYLQMKDFSIKNSFSNSGYEDLKILFFEKIRAGEDVQIWDLQIKRYYYNKKSRENKATKQANFSLSEQSIKNIEKIAKKYRVNKSMVVDTLFKSPSLTKQIDMALKNRLNFSLPDFLPPLDDRDNN